MRQLCLNKSKGGKVLFQEKTKIFVQEEKENTRFAAEWAFFINAYPWRR
jgi:hypothetical protein